MTEEESLKDAKAPTSVHLPILAIRGNYPKNALGEGKAAVCIPML